MTLEEWYADFTDAAFAYRTDPNGHENFFNWCNVNVPRLYAFAKQAQEFIKLEEEMKKAYASSPFIRLPTL